MRRFLVLLTLAASPAGAADLPPAVASQLPHGFRVLTAKAAGFGGANPAFYIVALAGPGDTDDGTPPFTRENAPARPLLLLRRQPDGSFRLVARNDAVIMRANEGGQCDPFLDGGATVAVKGPYFTVENGVACGQHWTDYITFRFDAALRRYVFDNERSESWSLNPSRAPDAEALVRDGPPRIRRADPARPVAFEAWRPAPPPASLPVSPPASHEDH